MDPALVTPGLTPKANMAHIRQSRPESGLCFKTFQVVISSLRSGLLRFGGGWWTPPTYRGISVTRKRTPLGLYHRPMPRVLGGFQRGGWAFSCGRGAPVGCGGKRERERASEREREIATARARAKVCVCESECVCGREARPE